MTRPEKMLINILMPYICIPFDYLNLKNKSRDAETSRFIKWSIFTYLMRQNLHNGTPPSSLDKNVLATYENDQRKIADFRALT